MCVLIYDVVLLSHKHDIVGIPEVTNTVSLCTHMVMSLQDAPTRNTCTLAHPPIQQHMRTHTPTQPSTCVLVPAELQTVVSGCAVTS